MPERGDGQHGDLAEGVEAAEVDEHDVDDVAAAALGQRPVEVGLRRRRRGARLPGDEHAPRPRRSPTASGDRERARACERRGGRRGEAARQPAQHEDEQHERQRLDEELRQREVRAALQHEQHRDAVADGAEQQDGGEPAVRAGGRDRGDGDDDRDDRLQRAVPGGCRSPLTDVPVSSAPPGSTTSVEQHRAEVDRQRAALDDAGRALRRAGRARTAVAS